MASWDVIVIGLGGVGSSTVFHLAEAGHRVLGIDRYAPPHAFGSSHGQTRIIRQAYFEHPAYVPLLARAYTLWDDLERQTDDRLFHRTGLVEMGPPDGIVIPGVLKSADEHQLDIEMLPVSEVHQRWPGIGGQDDWQAVIEHNAGFLRVEACIDAYLTAARAAGANLTPGVRVRQWQTDGSNVIVQTDQSVERAERLVITAGPWSSSLLANLDIKLQVLRKHLYWFQREDSGSDLEAGFPCFFHETAAGFFYGFPSIDGRTVKVARHSGGQCVQQPEWPHERDPQDQSLVEEYVAQCLPGVSRTLKDWAGCYYTTTLDEHFIVDRHPEYPQVALVAGLSGHGFKFASVLGEIASQLVTDGDSKHDTELFRIKRLRG